MPELPEVETVRRALAGQVVGRTIRQVRVHRPDTIDLPGNPTTTNPTAANAAAGLNGPIVAGSACSSTGSDTLQGAANRLLCGQRISGVVRHGKQLAWWTEPSGAPTTTHKTGKTKRKNSASGYGELGKHAGWPAVGVHLGMTGCLRVFDGGRGCERGRADRMRAEWGGHTHITWELDDGLTIAFQDPRRFGHVWVFATGEQLRAHRWAGLGPDALTITGEELHRRLGRTRRAIKAALLDQSLVAGLGNIYTDELLHVCRVHPRAPAASLSVRRTKRLADGARTLLAEAIEHGGSTLRDYADPLGQPGAFQAHHAVYARHGQACPRCQSKLSVTRVASRTTTYCSHCQRK